MGRNFRENIDRGGNEYPGSPVSPTTMETRTTQDLLAERRANVLESMRETDAMAQAMLLAHVDTIDAELARRR